MKSQMITIDSKILFDISDMLEDMQLRIESIALMNDKEFMDSLKRSKEQIKNRDFANWDEL